MPFIDEMRNLRKDMESGKKIRSRRIQEIKEESSTFVKDAARKRREDFKVLTEGISGSLTNLKTGVKAARKENRAEQRELGKELSAASAAFWGKEKQERKQFKKGGE